MMASKYEKYFIREPFAVNIFPPFKPRLYFDSQNYFPEVDFGIRYTYITQPIQMGEAGHSHDFDQFFCFMGTPEDVRIFDGEVELYLGEEGLKNIINSTTVVYIPKGTIHCPVKWTKVNKPMMFVNVILTPRYIRSAEKTFQDLLELTAKKVTEEEAGRILKASVPHPAYLPEGYIVQEIYAQDNSIRLFISDKKIEKRKRVLGDATGTRERYTFKCEMSLGIKWYPKGKGDSVDLRGELVTINKGKGVMIDQEDYFELWWLLPPRSTSKQLGQYEIGLFAGKGTSKEELLKVAQSVAV
jgi:hypothetical protein